MGYNPGFGRATACATRSDAWREVLRYGANEAGVVYPASHASLPVVVDRDLRGALEHGECGVGECAGDPETGECRADRADEVLLFRRAANDETRNENVATRADLGAVGDVAQPGGDLLDGNKDRL